MTKGAGLLPTPFYFPVNLATIACQVSGFKMLIEKQGQSHIHSKQVIIDEKHSLYQFPY